MCRLRRSRRLQRPSSRGSDDRQLALSDSHTREVHAPISGGSVRRLVFVFLCVCVCVCGLVLLLCVVVVVVGVVPGGARARMWDAFQITRRCSGKRSGVEDDGVAFAFRPAVPESRGQKLCDAANSRPRDATPASPPTLMLRSTDRGQREAPLRPDSTTARPDSTTAHHYTHFAHTTTKHYTLHTASRTG